jgi:alkylation response protein AidB-like acyl-CoA dehydrogenase
VDFSLSQEQQLLQDSVSRFVADHCGVERHRQLSGSELGYEPAAWQQFADLGWLAIPFSEEQGGIGGSAVDVMVISEALGRGLLREPFLSTGRQTLSNRRIFPAS